MKNNKKLMPLCRVDREKRKIAITNYAASAIKTGCTTREVEKAIREIRKRIKELSQDENDSSKLYAVGCAINKLKEMGK